MQDCRRFTWASALVAIFIAIQNVPCGAAEPQVAFNLKDGWVEFVIRQDGRPVPNVIIRILNDGGNKFAEGETGPEGQTTFPPPPGSSFLVEIKAGERTADPIRRSLQPLREPTVRVGQGHREV